MPDEFSCKPGDWVEIEYVLLEPAERAAGIPEDTAAQPLRAWVKGFAREAGLIGDEIEIETMSGRTVRGHLSATSPGYTHSFGTPPPEIIGIGRDARARVTAYRAAQSEGEGVLGEPPATADAEAGE